MKNKKGNGGKKNKGRTCCTVAETNKSVPASSRWKRTVTVPQTSVRLPPTITATITLIFFKSVFFSEPFTEVFSNLNT